MKEFAYCQLSNIRCILVGNNIVDHTDVVWASPVDTVPTTSWFSTLDMTSIDWAKTTVKWDEKYLKFGICGISY